ncbi:hypothetical protein BDY19DRAFT_994966, partial [Irpex rosettiformis]
MARAQKNDFGGWTIDLKRTVSPGFSFSQTTLPNCRLSTDLVVVVSSMVLVKKMRVNVWRDEESCNDPVAIVFIPPGSHNSTCSVTLVCEEEDLDEYFEEPEHAEHPINPIDVDELEVVAAEHVPIRLRSLSPMSVASMPQVHGQEILRSPIPRVDNTHGLPGSMPPVLPAHDDTPQPVSPAHVYDHVPQSVMPAHGNGDSGVQIIPLQPLPPTP